MRYSWDELRSLWCERCLLDCHVSGDEELTDYAWLHGCCGNRFGAILAYYDSGFTGFARWAYGPERAFGGGIGYGPYCHPIFESGDGESLSKMANGLI